MNRIVQHSFLGGVLDAEMMGRQDLQRYSAGASRLENFLVKRRGAISKRPGTDRRPQEAAGDPIADYIGGSDAPFRLVPFCYSRNTGFAILFAAGKARAYGTCKTGENLKKEVLSDGATFFSADQLASFDYCQCGDVLFLAHRDHPPCRIEHTVETDANGDPQHVFRLKPMDFDSQTRGIPSIRSAAVTKLQVSNGGGVVTERYKVSAVYDGAETVPSDPYAGFPVNDAVSHTGAKTDGATDLDDFVPQTVSKTSSTSYHAPWTESQTIQLAIRVPSRPGPDGPSLPDQIRVYKKQGAGYGLVGSINKEDFDNTISLVQQVTDTEGAPAGAAYSDAAFKNSPAPENASSISLAERLDDPPKFGINRAGWKFTHQTGSVAATHELFVLSLQNAVTSATVTICPGVVTYAAAQDGNSVVFTFTPSNVRVWKAAFTFDNGASRGPYSSSGETKTDYQRTPLSKTIARQDGETADDFETRWRAGLADFADSIAARHSVVLDVKTSNSVLGETPASSTVAVYCVHYKDTDTSQPANCHAVLNHLSVSYSSSSSSSSAAASSDNLPLWQEAQIAATDGKTVFFTDRNYAPDFSLSPPEKFDGMQGPGDYPGCVCLHQQRLVWASSRNDPRRIWMSHVGDFYTYAAHETLADDDPIDFQMASSLFPEICHMAEMRRLFAFNGASEWVISSASQSSPITYATVQAVQHSAIGADPALKPLLCNNVLLFAEATGRAVRAYSYQLEDDGYGGVDLSVFSQSLFDGRRIVSWAFQQHPDSTCWCVLSDGSLASLTFNREHNTAAWAHHSLGGNAEALAVAASGAIVSATDANHGGNDSSPESPGESEIFLLVRRKGVLQGGADEISLETLRPQCAFPADGSRVDGRHLVCLDSCRFLRSGFLRKGEVAVDIRTGEASAPAPAYAAYSGPDCYAGFPYDARFTSVFPSAAEATGSSHLDVRSVQTAYLRFLNSSGGRVWAEDAPEELASALVSTRPDFGTGGAGDDPSYFLRLPSGSEAVPLSAADSRDGRVNVASADPWPFTLVLLEFDLQAENPQNQRN